MKTRKLTGTVFVALLTVSTASAIAEVSLSPAKMAAAAAAQKPVVAPQDNDAKEKLKDNTFVEQAAMNGMATVEISKLAATKASDQKLKKYAAAAMKDQSANNIKLQQVAAQTRLDLPKKLDEPYGRMIKELNSLQGAEFDKAYINLMKKSQDTNVALFDNAAGEPTLNVDLRVFANQTLPSLRARQENTHALLKDSDDDVSQR